MHHTITLPAPYLRALIANVARDDVRYYLAGINLDRVPDSADSLLVLTATDGHALVSIETETYATDVALPAPVILALPSKKLPKAAVTVTLDVTATHTHYRADTTTGRLVWDEHTAHIDGRFPDWRKAISPTTSGRHGWRPNLPGAALNLNPELLARTTRALTADATVPVMAQLEFCDPPKADRIASPIRADVADPRVTVIVMPAYR